MKTLMSQRTTKSTINFATSEDSDQPAHPHSLIRVFADRMCHLQPPGYPKKDNGESLTYWVYVQPDLSLCWLHRSYCRFCRALAQFRMPEFRDRRDYFRNSGLNGLWSTFALKTENCKTKVEFSHKSCFSTMKRLSRNLRKRAFWHVHPTKTQISLSGSKSSLSVWRYFASLAIQNAPSEDSDRTARTRSPIWIFAGRACPTVCFLTLWLKYNSVSSVVHFS